MALATASGLSPKSDPLSPPLDNSGLSSYCPSEDAGRFLPKWTSRGLTHGFDRGAPPEVDGRALKPGPGAARLVEEELAKFMRKLASEGVCLRLEKLVFLGLESSCMLDVAAATALWLPYTKGGLGCMDCEVPGRGKE